MLVARLWHPPLQVPCLSFPTGRVAGGCEEEGAADSWALGKFCSWVMDTIPKC